MTHDKNIKINTILVDFTKYKNGIIQLIYVDLNNPFAPGEFIPTDEPVFGASRINDVCDRIRKSGDNEIPLESYTHNDSPSISNRNYDSAKKIVAEICQLCDYKLVHEYVDKGNNKILGFGCTLIKKDNHIKQTISKLSSQRLSVSSGKKILSSK